MQACARMLLAAAAIAAIAPSSAAGGPAPDDLAGATAFVSDAPITTTVTTPHIRWARPFRGGPIRVFTSPNVRAGRDVAELAQRLDLTLTTVTVDADWRLNALGLGDFALRRGARERRPAEATFRITDDYLRVHVNRARHYDCYVIPSARGWNALPADVRDAIVHDVTNGAGLVLIRPLPGPGEPDQLNRVSPLAARPDSTASERCRRWRPRREPHFITRGVPLDLLPVERSRHGRYEAAGTVLLTTDTGDPVLGVRPLGRGRVAAFAYDAGCLAPRLSEGNRDDRLDRGLETAFSLLCRTIVWAAGREPKVSLARLTASPPSLYPDVDRVPHVEVTVADASDPRGGPAMAAGVQIRLTLRNEGGRETATRSALVPLAPGQSRTVRIPLPPDLDAGLNVADVIVSDGVHVFDWGSVPMVVQRPATVDALEVSKTRYQQRERVEGVAIVRVIGPTEVETTVTLTDRWGRLLAEQVLRGHVDGAKRFPFALHPQSSLSSAAVLRCTVRANGRQSHARRRHVFFEMPAVPNVLTVVLRESRGAVPAAGWRPALEGQYARLGITALAGDDPIRAQHSRLRALAEIALPQPDGADPRTATRELVARGASAWAPLSPMAYEIRQAAISGEDLLPEFRTWLQWQYGDLSVLNAAWGARISDWKEVAAPSFEAARENGRFEAWLDYRACAAELLRRRLGARRRALRRVDPFARTAVRATDAAEVDIRDGTDVIFPAPFPWDAKSTVRPAQRAAADLWRHVLEEQHQYVDLGPHYTLVNPDLTLSGVGRAQADVMDILHGRGLARLTLGARRDHSGIAIHSPPATIRRVIDEYASDDGSSGPSAYAGNLAAWTATLRNAGLGYRPLRRDQIEGGGLRRGAYRVLILPMAWSLTRREAEAIRDFVRNGGALVADSRPGQMDGHARWLKRGLLDDVFGVRQSRFGPKGAGRVRLKGAWPAPGTGEQRIIVHRFGRGRAALIGRELARPGGSGIDLSPLRAVFGVQPPSDAFLASSTAGGVSPWSRITRYVDGDARYLAGARVSGEAGPLKLSRPWHVYDCLAGVYVGRTGEVTLGRSPQAMLLALLPQRVEALTLDCPSRIATGEDLRYIVRLRAGGGFIGRHVVAVDIVDASGVNRPEYHRNLDRRGGLLPGLIPLALNDPPGRWTLHARDAATGLQAKVDVDVYLP